VGLPTWTKEGETKLQTVTTRAKSRRQTRQDRGRPVSDLAAPPTRTTGETPDSADRQTTADEQQSGAGGDVPSPLCVPAIGTTPAGESLSPAWTKEMLAAAQADDPDIAPIYQWLI